MECFRQIFRCIRSPFRRNDNVRVLEIGAPTNFRKEELPNFFSDADTLASNSHVSMEEKDAVVTTAECQTSTRDKIKHHARRMSVKLSRSAPNCGEDELAMSTENHKGCPE